MAKNQNKIYRLLITALLSIFAVVQSGINVFGSALDVQIQVTPKAVLSGVPTGNVDPNTALSITVGGSSVNVYKYKIDNGSYSAERPVSTKITDTLSSGSHTLYVIGGTGAPQNLYQPESAPTTAQISVGGGGSPYRPVCGNFIHDYNEECDDGNRIDGDGCSASCTLEPTLLSPESCSGAPDVNAVEWQWKMPQKTSEHTGFRLTKQVDASETTILETTAPDTYKVTETGLEPNTPYANRQIYAINGELSSDGALCEGTFTLMPTPETPLNVNADAVQIQAALPEDLTINNLEEGQAGVWYEIQENVSGQFTVVENSGWVKNSSISFNGLKPGTNYALFYKLRNANGIETRLSPGVNVATNESSGTLEINKTATTNVAGQVEVDEVVSYEVSYVNTTGYSLANIVFSDPLSQGVSYVTGSLVSSDKNDPINYDANSHTLQVEVGSLPAGGSGSFTYQAKALSPIINPTINNQTFVEFNLGAIKQENQSNLVTLDAVGSQVTVNLFEDFNKNGTQDSNEDAANLGSPTISLYQDDELVLSQNISDGSAVFGDLSSGNYRIEVSGLGESYQLSDLNNYSIPLNVNENSTVNLAVDSTLSSLDIEFYNDLNQNNAKDEDENAQGIGTPDVSLNLDGQTVITLPAENGNVFFSNLSEGFYEIDIQNLSEGFYVSSEAGLTVNITAETDQSIQIPIQTDNVPVAFEIDVELESEKCGTLVDLTVVDQETGELTTFEEQRIIQNSINYTTNELASGNYLVAIKRQYFLSKLVSEMQIDPETLNVNITNLTEDPIVCKPGDIAEDDIINALDLSKMISEYGLEGSIADLNNDGYINAVDLAMIIQNYLEKGDLRNL